MVNLQCNPALKSFPIRGAWIEIQRRDGESQRHTGRSPSGERGLEYGLATPVGGHDRVAPHQGSVD